MFRFLINYKECVGVGECNYFGLKFLLVNRKFMFRNYDKGWIKLNSVWNRNYLSALKDFKKLRGLLNKYRYFYIM